MLMAPTPLINIAEYSILVCCCHSCWHQHEINLQNCVSAFRHLCSVSGHPEASRSWQCYNNCPHATKNPPLILAHTLNAPTKAHNESHIRLYRIEIHSCIANFDMDEQAVEGLVVAFSKRHSRRPFIHLVIFLVHIRTDHTDQRAFVA